MSLPLGQEGLLDDGQHVDVVPLEADLLAGPESCEEGDAEVTPIIVVVQALVFEPSLGHRTKGQLDASIHFSKVAEPEREKVIRPADQRSQDAAPLAPDAVVKLGDHVTIAPSTISGWEARLTRGWTAYDVTLDGKPVKGDHALEAIDNPLRDIQSAPKGKAK